MLKIIFEDVNGEKIEVNAKAGESLMRVAVAANVAGIDADCGGACSCATCHVAITEEFVEMVGPAGEMERDMIEFEGEPGPTSRLSCQVVLTDSMDGLQVRVLPHH